MSKVNTAPIKWAQRSDSLYITIALPDVKEETVTLADETLKFTGKSENKEYEVDIAFLKAVDSAGSTYKVMPRSIHMHVMKKEKKDADEEEEEFWPRLLKDKALEKNQVKVDWDRYVDEDEEEEGFDTSAMDGGQAMGGMPGMGGMGGMPGMGGGEGGMPGGMDMASMMSGMGGMGGAGGGMPGGMDMEALMKQMGGMGGAGGNPMAGMEGMGGMEGMDSPDSDDDDDDGLPDLEES